MSDGRFTIGDSFTVESDGLRYALHKGLMQNELMNGYGAFEIKNAELANSGPSFGALQYDLGSNNHGRKLFEKIATEVRDDQGNRIITDDQLSQIKANLYKPFKSMSESNLSVYKDLKPLMDTVLSSEKGKSLIYDDYVPALDKKVDAVREVVNSITHPSNKTFLESDITSQLILADTLNQYGSIGPQFKQFLNGETSRGVTMSGSTLAVEDLLSFKMTFEYAKKAPKDVVRRHNNAVSIGNGEQKDINSYGNYEKDPLAQKENEISAKLANIQALNEKLNDPSGEKLLSEADQSFFGRDILLTSHEGDMAQLGGYLAKLGLVEENANTENILSAMNQFERTNYLPQDNTNWSGALSALKDQYITHQKDEVTNEIQAERQAMAQLELDRITDINEQQAKLTNNKEELTGDIALKGAQIIALQGLQENFANNASNDNVANNPLSETAMSLLNKNTLNLNNDKTGEVTDLKQLQTVLKEEGYLKGKADGLWGNDTEQALAKATGLTQEEIKAIDPKSLEAERSESLRDQYLEHRTTQLMAANKVSETKITTIDDQYNALENQRIPIIEQQIRSEQANIQQLQNNIEDYDKIHITPLTALQQQLANDPKHYESIEKELMDNHITLLSTEQNALCNGTQVLKQGSRANDINDVKALQTYLIEQEYLAPTWKDKHGVEHPSNDGNFGNGTTQALKAYQSANNIESDGLFGKDARATMKTGILNELTVDDIQQKVQTEITVRNEDKIPAIAELTQKIEQAEKSIDQLQSEQQYLATNQINLQEKQPRREILQASTGDVDLDRILQTVLDGDFKRVGELVKEMVQRPDMQELNQSLLAEARQTNDLIREQQQGQQEMARQQALQQEQALQEQQNKQQSGPSMSL